MSSMHVRWINLLRTVAKVHRSQVVPCRLLISLVRWYHIDFHILNPRTNEWPSLPRWLWHHCWSSVGSWMPGLPMSDIGNESAQEIGYSTLHAEFCWDGFRLKDFGTPTASSMCFMWNSCAPRKASLVSIINDHAHFSSMMMQHVDCGFANKERYSFGETYVRHCVKSALRWTSTENACFLYTCLTAVRTSVASSWVMWGLDSSSGWQVFARWNKIWDCIPP